MTALCAEVKLRSDCSDDALLTESELLCTKHPQVTGILKSKQLPLHCIDPGNILSASCEITIYTQRELPLQTGRLANCSSIKTAID